MRVLKNKDNQYILIENISLIFSGKNDKTGLWELYIALQSGMAINFIDVDNCDSEMKAQAYVEAALKRIDSSNDVVIDLVEISKDMNKFPENYGIPTLRKSNG
jgi:hypothetical protein